MQSQNIFPLAAHCVKKIPANWKLRSVRLGEWDTASDRDCSADDPSFCAPEPLNILIIEIIAYSDYRKQSRNQDHDIALLRLAKRVKFDDFVQPLCLPLDPELWTYDYTNHTFETAGLKVKYFKCRSY